MLKPLGGQHQVYCSREIQTFTTSVLSLSRYHRTSRLWSVVYLGNKTIISHYSILFFFSGINSIILNSTLEQLINYLRLSKQKKSSLVTTSNNLSDCFSLLMRIPKEIKTVTGCPRGLIV